MKVTNISYTMFFNLVSNSVKYTNTCIYILEFTSCPGIHGTILLKFCCKSSYLGSLLKKKNQLPGSHL